MPIISLKKVNKFYGDQKEFHALKDIDFSVEDGEFVVILGQSGSGKSTLLNIIGGLDTYDSGEVVLDGKNYQDANDYIMSKFRSETIGFVFQAYNLIPVLSVYENIVFPVEISRRKVDDEYINALMEGLSITEKKFSYPNKLSGGQQQRVAIARALANKPKIILADEPTGNLDVATGEEVLSLLKKSAKQFGQTMIMITHNPEIAKLADRIVTLKDGQFEKTTR